MACSQRHHVQEVSLLRCCLQWSIQGIKRGNVPLDVDEPAVIEAVLKYIYVSKYSDEGASNLQEAIEPLVFNMCMYIIADKYNIYSLTALATEKFKKRRYFP